MALLPVCRGALRTAPTTALEQAQIAKLYADAGGVAPESSYGGFFEALFKNEVNT